MAKRRTDSISLRRIENSDGSITFYARYQAPYRDEQGEIRWRRVERSTRVSDERKAQREAERLKDEDFKKGYAEPKKQKSERNFADAARAYMKAGGDGLYMLPILDRIESMSISDIDQSVVDGLAAEIYPKARPSTLNRQLYTPIIAVLKHAEDGNFRRPQIKRPKGWLPKSNFKRPPRDWWARVLSHCEPNLAAFILFCRIHMRRTSEACRIKKEDIDSETWRVTVRDTKEDQEIVFRLADAVIEQLNRYPWRLNQYVFGFSSKSKVYPALRAACERAGVPYHVPKDVGRHSGATFLLEQGKTLKEVQEAGRWSSVDMPAAIYGHLEHTRVDEDVRKLNEQWLKDMGEKGEVIDIFSGGHVGDKKTKSG